MSMRLNQDEIDKLVSIHKQIAGKKEADKVKCIIYWGKGYSWEQIKEILFIADSTIKKWVDKYESGGIKYLLDNKYSGHNFKLTIEQEKQLERYIERNNVLTSHQVCHYVYRKFGVRYTDNGMTKTLIRLGFSYKKPKRKPCKISKKAQLKFVKEYLKRSENLPQDESIYFMDGAGFEHNSKLDYGWMKKGTSKSIKTNTGRKRINVNGAYNPKTQQVVSIEHEKTVSTQSNIELIHKIIALNHDKRKITIILDNARMNKSQELFDFIRKQNKEGPIVQLLFLPPYSPHLNLIERLWRFSKKKLMANQYYSSFIRFKYELHDFFENKIHHYKQELKKLMTEKFPIYESIS